MAAAAAEFDPDVALALVCAVADTLVVPVFMQLLRPHDHLIGMYATCVCFEEAFVNSKLPLVLVFRSVLIMQFIYGV